MSPIGDPEPVYVPIPFDLPVPAVDGLHSNISVFVTLSDTPVSYPPPIELPINELALIIGVLMTDGVE
ncbi:hypothetical protein, partial [Enterobacter asburiae]|uniref:hypothetical protein n=1 Tax=Enterobacter asburiae TaxID=61645 RepID=UPI001952C772